MDGTCSILCTQKTQIQNITWIKVVFCEAQLLQVKANKHGRLKMVVAMRQHIQEETEKKHLQRMKGGW